MKNRLLTLQKLVPKAIFPSRENGNGVAFIKRPGDEVGNPDNTDLGVLRICRCVRKLKRIKPFASTLVFSRILTN